MKIAEIPSAPGYYATDEGDIISNVRTCGGYTFNRIFD